MPNFLVPDFIPRKKTSQEEMKEAAFSLITELYKIRTEYDLEDYAKWMFVYVALAWNAASYECIKLKGKYEKYTFFFVTDFDESKVIYSNYCVGEKNWRKIRRQFCPPGIIGAFYKTETCKMEGVIFAYPLESDLFNNDPNFDIGLLGNVSGFLYKS